MSRAVGKRQFQRARPQRRGGDLMDGYSFRFAAPWLLALIPALALLLWWRARRRRGAMATMRYSDVRPVAVGGHSLRMMLRPLLPALQVLTLAALIVALARPQWVQAREVVHGEGVDIALALDISGSMASLDFEPNNRLDAAKAVISGFIDDRTHDRMGLVVFAATPTTRARPPSTIASCSGCWGTCSLPRPLGWRMARQSAWGWRTQPTCSRIHRPRAAL